MKRTLLFLLIAIQTGCTSWHYRVEKDKVVFGIRSWNHDPLDYPVEGADVASFRTLKNGYAMDGAHVYLQGERIENAEPATFQILKDGYAKDRHRVFLSKCTLEGADPRSWMLIAEYWSRDSSRVYQGYSVVPGAHPETFRHIKGEWAIDDKRAYHHLNFYSADCHVEATLQLTVFDSIDPSSFEVIDGFHAKDAHHQYDALRGPNQPSQPMRADGQHG